MTGSRDVRDVEALRVAIAVAADRLGPVTVVVGGIAIQVQYGKK